jgi:sugar transferase (PEP-CTERM system associated)
MESILIFASFLTAIWIRLSFHLKEILYVQDPVLKGLIFTAICQFSLFYFDLYSFKHGNYKNHLIKKLPFAMGVAALFSTVISYIFPSYLIGRGFLLISLLIASLFIVAWRRFYSLVFDNHRFSDKTIIVGSGALAKEIGSEILANRALGYHIIGFIDEDPRKIGQKVLNPGIIGDYRGLSKISDKEEIDHIIVAMPERRGILPVDELLKCKMAGIDVEDGVSFFERMTGKVDLDELKPSWLIFSDGFKINKMTRTFKRSADILFSSLGILFSIPFFIILPLFLKLDSPGPVFFRQERIGENESIFTLMKFRSMRVDAETGSGPVWAQKDDPRVTRLGKFIRKTRIDEIPQLFNVLKGEMSFVGPRPERPNFVKTLNEEIPYYILRHTIKPGLTGWAQIRYPYGSSVKDAIEKLKYDLYYIKNVSFLLDIAIIFSTVRVVISRRGAR